MCAQSAELTTRKERERAFVPSCPFHRPFPPLRKLPLKLQQSCKKDNQKVAAAAAAAAAAEEEAGNKTGSRGEEGKGEEGGKGRKSLSWLIEPKRIRGIKFVLGGGIEGRRTGGTEMENNPTERGLILFRAIQFEAYLYLPLEWPRMYTSF